MAEIKSFSGWKEPKAKGIPRDLRDEHLFPILADARSPTAERFRRLKTMIEHVAEQEGIEVRTIVMSSSREEEGKTLTCINLALSLAEERDRSVVLVDCDLHRPRVHAFFRNPPRIGLMDVFADRAELDSAIVGLSKSRLHVLPAGNLSETNAAEVLKSTRFREILAQLRDRYDFVLLDSPPVMRFVDANLLNAQADGMVFVVRARMTARQLVRRAVGMVTAGRILGLVFNDAKFTVVDRYYYGYDEYGRSYYDD